MRVRYTVWYGSIQGTAGMHWWVLDTQAEKKWGYLAKPTAGPFATQG